MKKSLYLFLALLLPGLIYIFLKKFGKNEFAIPVYYSERADSLNTRCGTHYTTPYFVADSVLLKAGWQRKKATIFLLEQGVYNTEMSQLNDSFEATEFQEIDLVAMAPNESRLLRWRQCVFAVKPQYNIVLMDEQRQLRGFYSGKTREEIDRLIVEMKILLRKY